MNILVTGATGYLGAEVIRILLSNREHVLFALIRSEEKFQRLLQWCNTDEEQLKPVKADICKLKELPTNTDAIIHTAAFRLDSSPDEATKINVEGTNTLLDLAVRHGVRRFIYTSSQSIYGWEGAPWSEESTPNPKGVYATTKYAAEKNVHLYEDRMDYIILRISRMYGVSLFARWDEVIPKFVGLMRQGKPISIYGDGSQRYDFIHVSDVAQCMVKIMDMYPEGWNAVYNVGGGRSVSLNEIVEDLTSISREMSLPEVIVSYKQEASSNSPSHLELDTTLVRNKTGWMPQHKMRDVVMEYFRAFQTSNSAENYRASQ